MQNNPYESELAVAESTLADLTLLANNMTKTVIALAHSMPVKSDFVKDSITRLFDHITDFRSGISDDLENGLIAHLKNQAEEWDMDFSDEARTDRLHAGIESRRLMEGL